MNARYASFSLLLALPSSDLLPVQVALWTLGQLVASTGYVVEPYRKYPTPPEVLLHLLQTEHPQRTRRAAGRPAPLGFQDSAGRMERERCSWH